MKNHLKDPRRNLVITASEAYNVIDNRIDLWKTKTNRKEKFLGNDATQWGNDNEKYCIDTFEKKNKCMVDWNRKFYVRDIFGATPDFIYNNAVGECKCPYRLKVYDSIPDRYYYQVQIQMYVMEMKKAHFCVWTPDDFKQEVIAYDQDFIDWYIPHAKEFLDYLATDTQPKRYHRKPKYIKE